MKGGVGVSSLMSESPGHWQPNTSDGESFRDRASRHARLDASGCVKWHPARYRAVGMALRAAHQRSGGPAPVVKRRAGPDGKALAPLGHASDEARGLRRATSDSGLSFTKSYEVWSYPPVCPFVRYRS